MVELHAQIPAAKAAGILIEQLDMLAEMCLEELRMRFRKLYRSPAPAGLSRDLIARLIAHRVQEQHLGRLEPDLARQLDRLGRDRRDAPRRLKTGTVLVREYEGVTHEVIIVPGGFLWNGQPHRSLSTIARTITGTSWSGPRFFGLRAGRDRGEVVSKERESADA
jgi:hypothetical protein